MTTPRPKNENYKNKCILKTSSEIISKLKFLIWWVSDPLFNWTNVHLMMFEIFLFFFVSKLTVLEMRDVSSINELTNVSFHCRNK